MMKKLCGIFLGVTLLVSGALAASDACEQGKFNADCLFPTWQSDENPDQATDAIVQGVIGANHDGGFAMTYIPRIIDILLKFIAPIVVIMLIWSGVRFIIAGSNDDELSKAKDFFTYAVIGVAFIVLSYSILKLVYFLIARG